MNLDQFIDSIMKIERPNGGMWIGLLTDEPSDHDDYQYRLLDNQGSEFNAREVKSISLDSIPVIHLSL